MAATTPRPAESSLSTPRIVVSPWLILVVLTMGFFMILLDTTIVNVAIPSMISDLHATLDQILWVLNAYILVYAVLLITAGRLGDMFGPKRMYLIGLVIFTISSFACGWAQSPTQLIVFRVVQAVGGALLTPQSMSIITSIFPPEKRGGAFGVWAASAGLAAVAGPTIGGLLTTGFSWRAIFFVNIPIGIVAVVLVWLIMPELTIHREHRLDTVGIGLASGGLFALVFALIEAQKYNWGRISGVAAFDLGPIRAGLISIPSIVVLSALLLVGFIIWETRPEEPLLPLSLFGDRNFTVTNGISFIVAFGMMSLFLPLTIFLQSILGMSALQAGVTLVPSSLTSMFVSPLMGRLSDRLSAKWILFSGLTLFAIGFGLVIWMASPQSTSWSFVLPLVVAGVGMGCTWSPMVTIAMRNISPVQSGAASGFINTIRQVGAAMGTAVVGAVLQHQLATEMSARAAQATARVGKALAAGHVSPQTAATIKSSFLYSLDHASNEGFHLGRGQSGGTGLSLVRLPAAVAHQVTLIGQDVFRHAYVNAMKPSLAVPICVLACGALVTMLLQTSGGARGEARAPERAETGVAVAGE